MTNCFMFYADFVKIVVCQFYIERISIIQFLFLVKYSMNIPWLRHARMLLQNAARYTVILTRYFGLVAYERLHIAANSYGITIQLYYFPKCRGCRMPSSLIISPKTSSYVPDCRHCNSCVFIVSNWWSHFISVCGLMNHTYEKLCQWLNALLKIQAVWIWQWMLTAQVPQQVRRCWRILLSTLLETVQATLNNHHLHHMQSRWNILLHIKPLHIKFRQGVLQVHSYDFHKDNLVK